MLAFISYHILSCKYTDFLFDSEKERESSVFDTCKFSIWDKLLEIKISFSNPYYSSKTNFASRFLNPNFSLHKLKLWEEYYFKYCEFFNINAISNKSRNSKMMNLTKINDRRITSDLDSSINTLNSAITEIRSKIKLKSGALRNRLSIKATTTLKDLIYD